MDFSGWFEVYLDNRWHVFDARHNTRRIGRIMIAYGRDAADVAISSTFGPNTLVNFQVWTDQVTSEGGTEYGSIGRVLLHKSKWRSLATDPEFCEQPSVCPAQGERIIRRAPDGSECRRIHAARGIRPGARCATASHQRE